MKTESVVVEKVLDAPVSRVWKVITDRNDMKKWFFYIAQFEPEVGFEFQFEGRKEEKRYVHLCKITEVLVNRKLTYSWKYEEYEGESFVTFELFPEGTKRD